MAAATKVLDETRFEARARIGDVVALGLVIVVGAALLFNMYTLDFTAATATSAETVARDKRFVIAIIEAALVVSGFAWIVYRLFSGSARRVGG